MKTLQNHLILYDAECPMCNMYTKAFVSTGLLDKQGRAAYQNIQADACPLVDRRRAVNEIALVNRETGEVSYGIRSLFKILGTAMPLLRPLFKLPPFVWLMEKVYRFISYNRRVIIPPTKAAASNELQPDFKLNYRIAYLLFTVVVTAYILTNYVHLMHGLLPMGSPYREYIVCGAQLLFQGTIVYFLAKDKLWDYLGNMMTVSFAGGLALLPGLIISHLFTLPALFYCLYFMAVAGLMFLEHIRRTGILKLGWTLSITWALYRATVLVLILIAK